ncbi:3746_t:CDS:2 [Cetraspora pellucida]|uniref:3746_t:CDS:1 n=1 Tax=Cetraspora pellucida TaxID=1433469 RepID=A0A9N9J2C3_9GLOM|nr:3746_t:CDS:2 [Cetraspora pellucida]
MSLSLPPTGYFTSCEALIQYAQKHAFDHGYAVSIKRSERNKFVYLYCDRDGLYRNKMNYTNETCQKATRLQLINCLFELHGKIENGQWYLTVKNANHNYKASEDISGRVKNYNTISIIVITTNHQLTKEEQQNVQQMSVASICSWEILSTLRQGNSDIKAIAKAIYNTWNKI